MSSSTLPDHIRRPHVRMFQMMGAQHDGKQVIVLRDPMALSPQMMAVPPQAVMVIQQFQGERTVEEIASGLKAPDPAPFIELAKRLDDVGLLWGPTFDRLEGELRSKLKEAGYFPSGGAQQPSPEQVKAALSSWLAETEDPELEGVPVGLIAPHLDYPRGWPNYAAAYRCLDRAETPDRVVILGTNHFGIGDGVVLTEFGFESPLGRVGPDSAIVERLRTHLGDAAFVDQLDHHAEHSIKLHLPWLQHRFGDVPVVAALVPDPLIEMIADDGGRTTTIRFVDALAESLQAQGGRTLFVSSADLSHVGPQFGEPRPVDAQRKVDVERVDRDLMTAFLSGDAQTFLDRAVSTKNPTRWCSIGNMHAALALAQPSAVEMIDYRQACDEQGNCLVSSAAMALMA